MILFCWVKALLRSLELFFEGVYIPMNGHDWQDDEEIQNATVFLSHCVVCGGKDISWKRN